MRESRRPSRSIGAAAALRDAIGAVVWPVERPAMERAIAAARDALGETAFDAAWAEGQAMSMEEAYADAIADDA